MTLISTKMFLFSVPGESLSDTLILEFNLAGSGECFGRKFIFIPIKEINNYIKERKGEKKKRKPHEKIKFKN